MIEIHELFIQHLVCTRHCAQVILFNLTKSYKRGYIPEILVAQAHWKFSHGLCVVDYAYTPKFFLISLTPLKQPKSHILYYCLQVMYHAGIQMEGPTLKISLAWSPLHSKIKLFS